MAKYVIMIVFYLGTIRKVYMLNNLNKFFYFYIIFILIISMLFVPILYASDSFYTNPSDYDSSITLSSRYFVWPIPGYTTISSYFGKRNSPTAGASSYHLGLDIPAPEGTYLYAIDDGIVTFASWGAGRRIHYCHKTF